MSKNNKDGKFDVADVSIAYPVTGDITGFAAGVGTASKSDSKWAGPSGATAYTVGDVVAALKAIGVLKA